MKTTGTGGNSVKTTKTAFAIIETLQEFDGARITELGDALGLANSTVHRHLTTLKDEGYVVKEGDTYHLGLRFLDIGQYVRTRRQAYNMIKPKAEELAEETEERAQFIVEEHGWAVYVHRSRGRRAIKTDPGIGKRVEIHTTSAGKAILSELPNETVATIIEERGLRPLTSNTITDPEKLLAELEAIRERGYSINNQENVEGLRALGVPIKPQGGEVIGALSVSGPTNRMKGDWFEEELPDLLLGTVNELELNIAYS